MQTKGRFEGTAAELLDQLKAHAAETLLGQDDWPKNAQVLAIELTRIAPLLREDGYGVDQVQTSGRNSRKEWRIVRPEQKGA